MAVAWYCWVPFTGTVVVAGLTVTENKVAVVTASTDVLVLPPKAAVMTVVPLVTPVARPVAGTMVPTALTPEDHTVELLTSRVLPSL